MIEKLDAWPFNHTQESAVVFHKQ